MDEQWKPIPDWEELYEASTLGRVRRIHASRKTPHRFPAGHILSPALMKTGYAMLPLSRGPRGTRISFHLARLILRTFTGEPPTPAHQVNHKNGKRADDRLENLEWVTQSENQRHAYDVLGKAAKMPRGVAHHNARMTEAMVRAARRLRVAGWTHRAIAQRFGVSRPTITAVLAGRNWKHVRP